MRTLRKAAFALVPTLALLLVFTLGFLGEPENDPWLNGSPLWGPGDPFYSPDPEQGHNLADPVLIWRARPGFSGVHRYLEGGVRSPYRNNAWGFHDDELLDPKPAGVVRVLNLGDSATWGLNLTTRAEGYSDQLQARLDARPGAGRFEVVNAGVVGYSSFQGAQLVRLWLDALDGDVVTVYLGNNDPSPAVVADADRVVAGVGPLHRTLQRNRFYLLLVKGLLHLRAAGLDRQRVALTADETESLAERYASGVRVSPDAYEQNLREIVGELRAAGVRPLLLDVPANLLWPPRVRPFASQVLKTERFWGSLKIEPGYLARTGNGKPACFGRALGGHPYLCRITPRDLESHALPDAAELSRRATDPALPARERLRAAHNRAVHALAAGELADALAALEVVAETATRCDCARPVDRSWIHYNRGVALLLLERSDAAFEALTESRRAWPFAMSPDYRERFRHVVEELDVEWIDLPARFAAADPRFRGSALIHDWVHPNARGNAVVAEALAERLSAPGSSSRSAGSSR